MTKRLTANPYLRTRKEDSLEGCLGACFFWSSNRWLKRKAGCEPAFLLRLTLVTYCIGTRSQGLLPPKAAVHRVVRGCLYATLFPRMDFVVHTMSQAERRIDQFGGCSQRRSASVGRARRIFSLRHDTVITSNIGACFLSCPQGHNVFGACVRLERHTLRGDVQVSAALRAAHCFAPLSH